MVAELSFSFRGIVKGDREIFGRTGAWRILFFFIGIVFYEGFRIMRVSVAILSSRWLHGPQNGAKMESRWRQDGVKMAHVGAKMVLRWATWRALGSNLVTFVESWARSLRKVTDCKTLVKHNEKAG